ncbi:hypothetical protein C922_05278 [Plasmodium inui San Antonio 1]|uniref:Plasmodium RESA N-terminal domain-containing protein n=1 Tax=Plasmodium inui San Antonio 1 TaxID=1237626 RepID=W7A5H7_9APIC|nr:hypothetical protein C922_05278 [Plasmodium inui San Antonio 1]EUD64339.1 hypothetical protein C922_05278 [Plasmodium inui San Antonio 1]
MFPVLLTNFFLFATLICSSENYHKNDSHRENKSCKGHTNLEEAEDVPSSISVIKREDTFLLPEETDLEDYWEYIEPEEPSQRISILNKIKKFFQKLINIDKFWELLKGIDLYFVRNVLKPMGYLSERTKWWKVSTKKISSWERLVKISKMLFPIVFPFLCSIICFVMQSYFSGTVLFYVALLFPSYILLRIFKNYENL